MGGCKPIPRGVLIFWLETMEETEEDLWGIGDERERDFKAPDIVVVFERRGLFF